MAINVSQAFHRTSANPVDDTMTLTKAQMVAINDNLMPSYYLTVCQDDGYIYLYDKSATASPTTGKFTKFETGGGGGGSEVTVLTGTLTAAGWSNKSQTATVTGLLATDNGVIGALNTATTAQLEAMRDAVLSVSTVANGAVTFSCEETPSIDIPFGVLIGGSGSGGGSLPTGGTTGQVLTKKSSTDGDADWEDPAGGGHTIVNSAGTSMPAEDKLKFVGATVTDDSTNGQTVVTVDISSTDDYSTSETLIGRWFDGNDLFQRTYSFTMPSTQGNHEIVTLPTGSNVKDMQGGCIWNTNCFIPLSYVSEIGNQNFFCFMLVSEGKINIGVHDADLLSKPAWITVKYTKA